MPVRLPQSGNAYSPLGEDDENRQFRKDNYVWATRQIRHYPHGPDRRLAERLLAEAAPVLEGPALPVLPSRLRGVTMERDTLADVLRTLTPGKDIVMVTWKYQLAKFETTEFGLLVSTPGGTLAVADRPITGTDGRCLTSVHHLQRVLLEEPPVQEVVPAWTYCRYPVIAQHTSGETKYIEHGFRNIDAVRQYVRSGYTLLQPNSTARFPAAPAVAEAPAAARREPVGNNVF